MKISLMFFDCVPVKVIKLELVRGLHARRVRPLELQQRLRFRFRIQEGADVAGVDEAVPGDGAVVVVVTGGRPHRQERPPVLQRTDPEMEKDVTLNVVCIGHQGNFDIVPLCKHRQRQTDTQEVEIDHQRIF